MWSRRNWHLCLLSIGVQLLVHLAQQTHVAALEMPLELLRATQAVAASGTGSTSTSNSGINNAASMGANGGGGGGGGHALQFSLIGDDGLPAFFAEHADGNIGIGIDIANEDRTATSTNINANANTNSDANMNSGNDEQDDESGYANDQGQPDEDADHVDDGATDGDEQFLPIWFQQLRSEPPAPSLPAHFKHNNNNNNHHHHHSKSMLNKLNTAGAYKPAKPHTPPPPAHAHSPHGFQLTAMAGPRHCSIEITSKIPGICQAIKPIGSACISGEYMDLLSEDCL